MTETPSVLAGLTGEPRRKYTENGELASPAPRKSYGLGYDYLGPQATRREPADEPWLWDTGRPEPQPSLWDDRAWQEYREPAGQSGKGKGTYKPKPLGPDRLVPCSAHPGQRHWGANGAAGVLVWTRRKHTNFVLLALRGKGVQSGNTWSGTLGGAIADGETEWQAATREATEETHGLALGKITGSVVYTCECGWQYTTFVSAMQAGKSLPHIEAADWETQALAWVRADDVDLWPALHHRFAQAWPALRKLIHK